MGLHESSGVYKRRDRVGFGLRKGSHRWDGDGGRGEGGGLNEGGNGVGGPSPSARIFFCVRSTQIVEEAVVRVGRLLMG